MKSLNRTLQHIESSNIKFDPNNPRGLSEDQIITDPEFKKLSVSIDSYGILLPLIIKPSENDQSTYILIDGERRLRAALKVKLKNVPALIAKNDIDGRELAYQIHMLGVNWNKAAETKAIKRIINDLKLSHPTITENEIKKRILEITSHRGHEASDILRLCKYNDKTIETILDDKLEMSYAIQIDANFIDQLKKHYPVIITKYGEDKIREIMIDKAINGKLISTRFLMDNFKSIFKDRENKNAINLIIDNFLNEKDKKIDEALNDYTKLTNIIKTKSIPSPKKIPRNKIKVDKKESTTGKNTTERFSYKSIKIKRKQQTTIFDMRNKFEKIGSLLNSEEEEYIKEALLCLEMHCFKAATLMIWAAGISRILQYISKDLNDFNIATNSMSNTQRSVWKYHAKNFQKNVTTIEDIRVTSKDMHLLCYLVYKKMISDTEFNKLSANYKTRCDCAHPTDISLTLNEIISIFENVCNLIFNNSYLK